MNTLVDVTTDVTVKEEKCELANGYQQQLSTTKETLQELQLSKHPNYVPAQQQMNNTSSVARAVGNTSYGERPNRYIRTYMLIYVLYYVKLATVCTYFHSDVQMSYNVYELCS